jgi:hypothetical protein
MKTKGIRISDIKDGKCIPLSELLETIPDETQFFWAWLWLLIRWANKRLSAKILI